MSRRPATVIRPSFTRHYTRRTREEWDAALARCEAIVAGFRDDVVTAKTGRSPVTGEPIYRGPATDVSVTVDRLGGRTDAAVQSVLTLAAEMRARHDGDLANLEQLATTPLPPPSAEEIAQRSYYATLITGMIEGLNIDQVIQLATEQAETPTVMGAPQFGAAWADRLEVLAEQATRRFNAERIPRMRDANDSARLVALARRMRGPSLPADARTAHTDRPLLQQVDQVIMLIERSARVRIETLVTRQTGDAAIDRFANSWSLGHVLPKMRSWTTSYRTADELARALNGAYGLTTGLW